MFDGLSKVFWGIFIATFNINLGPVKILPAFVGFMVISSGINTIYIEHKTDEFRKTLDFSRIVISMSLLGGVAGFFIQGSFQYSILLQIWSTIFMAAELIMFYYFFLGIIKYFDSIGNKEVADRVIDSSRLYMIVFIIVIAILSCSMLFNLGELNTLLAIVLIILRISLMIMISGLKKELVPNDSDDEQGI